MAWIDNKMTAGLNWRHLARTYAKPFYERLDVVE